MIISVGLIIIFNRILKKRFNHDFFWDSVRKGELTSKDWFILISYILINIFLLLSLAVAIALTFMFGLK
jgi:hypothetical protein